MKNLHLKLALIFVTFIGQNLLGHVEIKEESDWKLIRPTLKSTSFQEIMKLKDSRQDTKTDEFSLVDKFDKLCVHIFCLKNKETFPLKNELDKDFYYLFDQSDIEAILKIINQLTIDLQEENFEHIQFFYYYKPKSTGGCIIS